MKKLILICFIVSISMMKVSAQTPFVIDFEQDLSGGAYPWTFSYGPATYGVKKETDTTLTITTVAATPYSSGYGIILSGLNGTWNGTEVVRKPVDISEQPTLKLRFKSSVNFNLIVSLSDTLTKASKHKNNTAAHTFMNVPGDNEYHNYEYTFTPAELMVTKVNDTTMGLVDSLVGQMILWFQPIAPATSVSGDFTFDRITLGEAPMITKSKDNVAMISSCNVFPNPAAGSATLMLGLKKQALVKATVSDIMGKELSVIFEGNTQTVNEQIDLSNLSAGIYTVNYFVDNQPAGTKILLVK